MNILIDNLLFQFLFIFKTVKYVLVKIFFTNTFLVFANIVLQKILIYYKNDNVSYLAIERADQSKRFIAPTYQKTQIV